jgi:PDZ domain
MNLVHLLRRALSIVALTIVLGVAAVGSASAAEKGVLGVQVGTPPPPAQGALVARVVSGGAAERAGLQPQDLIVEVDSQPIYAASDLTAYVGSRHAGDRITLTVMRFNEGKPERGQVTAVLQAGSPQNNVSPVATPAPKNPAPSRPATQSGPPAQGLTRVSWTTFTDPYEKAFQIEVPQGWKVAGGTLRKVSMLPNLVLRVLAPDRRTLIALGDADAAPYNAPIAARDYVRRFTERAMNGACSSLKIVDVKDLPDVEQLARSKSIGSYNQWSAAQTSFTCSGDRQAGMGGEAIAVLQYMTTLRSGHAQILAAFVTTSGQEQAADELLNHMVSSLNINQEWEAQQVEIGRRLGQAAMARWHAEQRQFQQMDDAITNTAHYVGTDGQHYDLDATPRYQWRTPDGHTVGTNTPTPPIPGATQLQPVQQ